MTRSQSRSLKSSVLGLQSGALLAALVGGTVLSSTGCAQSVGDIDRTQPDLVAKEHFLKDTDRKAYTLTAKLKKGKQNLVIEFLNDEYKENEFDRNLFVHSVKIELKK